ncbi:unnamed protein product [Anisakis simplex]|uniref:Breast carcinoma-amplified sequence 3 (inferred by orthology to a human protein) n=1 Tax=Anisakis simplex TaxID=6269 RepID=A0A0M3JUU5_ANISI|nr:unnamed protein product [Anisakis simplex]
MSAPIPPTRVNQKNQKKISKEQQQQQVQPQRHKESGVINQLDVLSTSSPSNASPKSVSSRSRTHSSASYASNTPQMAPSQVTTSAQKEHSPIYNMRGQTVRPQSVPEPSLVSSVAELVHDVMPQGSSQQPTVERIEWVCIQKCYAGDDCKRIIDVIVIGLARGYQIWALMESGDCEEILSERQGPLRVGRLLASDPEPVFQIHEDSYATSRPLFAIVDGNWHVPDRQYCTLSFLSLISAQFVRRIAFPDPICVFEASTKILVVCFTNRIVICDAMSLREQRSIYNCQINDNITTPFAISDVFIAYAGSDLVPVDQSCGGMAIGEEMATTSTSSYTSGVISVAKSLTKRVSAIGETVVSTLSSSPHSRALLSSIAHPGIVTVVDATKLPSDDDSEKSILLGRLRRWEEQKLILLCPRGRREEGKCLLVSVRKEIQIFCPHGTRMHTSHCERSEAIIAHFVAHAEPIGYVKFAPGAQMLLTSGQSSTYFHIFLLYPHPGSPALGAVRHIYTLYRGTTPAKVLSSAFSMDSRWLALATNHGTTHLFAICPYGGNVTLRTHGSRLVNRDSRFLRSAGLVDSVDSFACSKPVDIRGHQFGAPQIYKEHPCLTRACVARSVGNPRIGPYQNPIAMNAIAKIRQHYLSADNLSAWASDLTSVSLSSSSKRTYGSSIRSTEQHRLSVSFASNPVSPYEQPSLLIIGDDGVLTEYSLEISPVISSSSASSSAVNSISNVNSALMISSTSNPLPILSSTTSKTSTHHQHHHARLNSESPIQCKIRANANWVLQRYKSTADVRAPLTETSPFIVWLNNSSAKDKEVDDSSDSDNSCDNWIAHIEVFTYSEPHRRLWTGPQFTFKTYLSSGHSSADLVPPGDSAARSYPGINVMKSIPVMIEAASSLRSFDVDEPTQLVCGSWSSDAEYKSCDEHYDVLREKIEEAMKDLTTEAKSSAIQVSVRSVGVCRLFIPLLSDLFLPAKHDEGSTSDVSQNSPPSGPNSSCGSRDRDRDSISLQFANIDI